MIDTQAFRTKTIYQARTNPSVKNVWGIAIDVGFSSVKVFSPNAIACFPSFAKKLAKGQQFIGQADKKNILYEDEDGSLWLVGTYAQNMINAGDNTSATAALFVKDRFSSPMFKVIARVGLALGMLTNNYGSPAGKTLAVQTGLPPAHMEDCAEDLKDVLAGNHNFRIKVGEDDWKEIRFDLPKQNIRIMEQPKGSLIAVSTDRNGGTIPDAKKYLTSNALVLDPGFGTSDTFNIVERRIVNNATWDDLGMNRVLTETCNDIYSKYRTEINVTGIQKCLEKGTVRVTNRKERKSYEQSFGDILEANVKSVCNELLQKIDETYQGLFYHDYLIVTGGLGSVWFNQIKNYYSGLETLHVIPGTQNDNLDGIFSNVRGYYMNLLNWLKKVQKSA